MKPMRLILALLAVIAVLLCIAKFGAQKRNDASVTIKEGRRVLDSVKSVVIFDSAEIKRLLPRFQLKVDEFNKDSAYIHITRPKYVNRNGMFAGFKIENGKASSLFLNIQYFAEEWLFIQKYQFLLGDSSYTIIPFNVQTDNGDGDIWEWSSIKIDKGYESFIEQMGKAESGKIRFVGRQYEKVKPLTKQQMTDLYQGYQLFKAMGGKLN